MKAKLTYDIYFPTYSAALSTVSTVLANRGYMISEDDWFHNVNTGPAKPKPGNTVSLHIPLTLIDGTSCKKYVQVQVYNRGIDGNTFELNMYVN